MIGFLRLFYLILFLLQVPAVASPVQTACGGATVTRPVSSTAPTATRASGKLESVCVVQATGGSPVRTVSLRNWLNLRQCTQKDYQLVGDWLDEIRSMDLLCTVTSLCVFSPRMPSWCVWRAVQHVLSVLCRVVPLPPCDRRVWLPAWIHRTQLWSRSTIKTNPPNSQICILLNTQSEI